MNNKEKNEKIKRIVNEVLNEYLNKENIVTEILDLEKNNEIVIDEFKESSLYENNIYKLINIIILIENKKEYENEYKIIKEDLIENYKNWKENYHFSNKDNHPVSIIMKRFYEHLQDINKPLITQKKANEIIYQEYKEKEIQNKANILKNKYPKLRSIAEEVIRLEYENEIIINDNYIIRMISIIKLIEGKEEYLEVYNEILNEINKAYQSLNENPNILFSDKKNIDEMINNLTKHINDKNVPLLSYFEIKEKLFKNKLK